MAYKRYKDEEIPTVPKGHRVPKDVSPEARNAADFAFQVYIDVAAGRISPKRALALMKGAKELRNEVCGPIAQKVDVDVKGRLEHLLGESMASDEAQKTTEGSGSGEPDPSGAGGAG